MHNEFMASILHPPNELHYSRVGGCDINGGRWCFDIHLCCMYNPGYEIAYKCQGIRIAHKKTFRKKSLHDSDFSPSKGM
jgi:hypothetical protein